MITSRTRRALVALALTLSLVVPGTVSATDITESAQATDPVSFTVSVTTLDYGTKDSGTGDLAAPTFTTSSKSATNPFDVWMKTNAAGTGKIDPLKRLCLLTLPSGYAAAAGSPCPTSGSLGAAYWAPSPVSAGSTGTGVKIFGRTTLDATLRTTTFALGIINGAGAAALPVGSYTGTVTLTLLVQ